jgi:hypothetical protein
MSLTRYADWLEEYLHFTSGHEVPQLYHRWTGLGIIASVLKQNVYIDMGTYLLYPNLFVIMVDEASAGKSHAIERFGLNLLIRADEKDASGNKLYIYNQRITAAAMIKSMSELYKENGEHCVTVIAEELGFFTDMSGDNMNISNVLIKTFDNGSLSSETIARSLDYTPNAQLNIIGGTTPGSLKESVGKKFLEAGALSRMIFIHSEELSSPMPFPKPPKDNKMRREYLADDLNEFKTLRGKFKWTKESIEHYKSWYRNTWQNFQERKDKLLVKRMANKMLKIAMILSVARKHKLILELSDIIDAIKIRNDALDSYLNISEKLTTSEWGARTQSLLDIIKINKEMKHSDLLRKTHHYLGLNEFKNAIDTLVKSELIEIKVIHTKGAKKPTKVYVFKGD